MLKLISTDPTKFKEISVEFKGERVCFGTLPFDRSNITDPQRSLEPLNGYMANWPDDRQAALFDAYREARGILDNVAQIQRMVQKLKPVIATIYDIINLDEFFYWLRMHLNVATATSVDVHYNPDAGDRDLTYVREEYQGLVYLGVAMKPLLPIFGEFLNLVTKDVGNEYKEYHSMRLLDQRLVDRPEFKRLTRYVEANASYSKNTTTAIYAGLGSAELPDWLLALGLLRKVLLVDPRDNQEHIIQKIYNYLKSKMEGLDKNKKGFMRISDKHRPKETGREEDNMSIMESTRAKQEISPRVPRSIEHYIKNHWESAIAEIDPELDVRSVRECIAFAKKADLTFTDLHYMLAGCIVSPLFSARGLYLIDHAAMSIVIGIAQAFYVKRGFPILASLCTARIAPQETDDFSLSGGPAMQRVARKELDELNRIYPHTKRASGKELTARNNVGVEWIERLFESVSAYRLTYNQPELVDGFDVNGRKLQLPADFRNQVARFLIDLDTVYHNHH